MTKLQAAGYSTIALLAHALPSLDDLEPFIASVLGRRFGADPTEPLFSPQASALRRLVKECSKPAEPRGLPDSASTATSVARPRLQASDVIALVSDVSRKYPCICFLRGSDSLSLNKARDRT